MMDCIFSVWEKLREILLSIKKEKETYGKETETIVIKEQKQTKNKYYKNFSTPITKSWW